MHAVTGCMLLGGIEWGERRGREGNREREDKRKKVIEEKRREEREAHWA